MGKVRRQRNKLHLEAKTTRQSPSSSQEKTTTDTTPALFIKPQENLFGGLNINVDSLTKNLSDDVQSVKSFKSAKSESGKVLSKKDKLKLRREMLLKKFEVMHQQKVLDKKKKKEGAAADLNPLRDALPSLESLLKSRGSVLYKQKQSKKKRGIEKAKTLKKNHIQGVICNLNGSWISEAAGMRFDIVYKNSTRKKFRIHVADRIPPNEDGFLCDGNWTLFGEIPFVHSGMVIALAVHEKDKHIATFIGECRICEGSETVSGTWLIGRSSRDCKDQKAAHKILSDVWRREQAHTLRKKHLQQIGYSVKDED